MNISVGSSLLGRIHTILWRQPSRLSQELFDRQPSLIHAVMGLCQGLGFGCLNCNCTPFENLFNSLHILCNINSFTHELYKVDSISKKISETCSPSVLHFYFHLCIPRNTCVYYNIISAIILLIWCS